MGSQFCRNLGIKISKYNWIAFIDDDDEWLPTKLEKQIFALKNSDENIGIIYTFAVSIDEKNNIKHFYNEILNLDQKKQILEKCFIPSPSVLIKKRALISSGFFDEKLVSCQDWDMWLRIIFNGYRCYCIQEYLSIHHKHNFNSIGKNENVINGFYGFYKKHIWKTYSINKLLFLKYLKNIIFIYLKKII